MIAALLFVGSLALQACAGASDYYCGTLTRPLDPAGEVPGNISIGFTWLPHSQSRVASAGTIVAAEGGPGYPSGASRDGYRALFGSLLRTHDMLLMDDRGTGRSGAIDCGELQGVASMTLAGITSCGELLGDRSDLYGTGLAADDLDALLAALSIDSVDLYGDSYGTFFVQVFAARHRARVRSVTLDAAYPAIGDDPWYPSTAPEFRAAFDRVCRRAPACATLPGTTLERITQLLAVLRKGEGPMTPAQLAFIMDGAGLDPLPYRELDAAARAYLAGGDDVPLHRLAQEATDFEEVEPSSPQQESNGLFVASSCSDNPQAYDMRLAPPARVAAWQRALSEKTRIDSELYAPFTIEEFMGIPLDYAYVPLCQTWPVASPRHPAGQAVPPGAIMPDVPALVLTGDLDTITTPAEGDAAAALFRNAERVIVANTGHVTAVGDVYHCASVIVRGFIAREPVDAACASGIPPMRIVPSFARYASDVPASTAVGVNRQSDGDLRETADAVLAAGDAVARIVALGVSSGTGLRGGTFDSATTASVTLVRLRRVKWTVDLPVSGTVAFDSRSGDVEGRLSWPNATVRVTWPSYAPDAQASIAGKIGSRDVRARMPAP
jgi:pimeloyl-ACP methyl ester carboxylesterase